MRDRTQHHPRGGGSAGGEPAPAPLRFFGTSWAEPDRGAAYVLRRVAVGLGALVLAVAGVLVWVLVMMGLETAETGTFVTVLMAAAAVLCSVLAAHRTWTALARGEDAVGGDPQAMAAVMAIGCVGSLLAYLVRDIIEAPGEGVRRAEWERALKKHAERGGRGSRQRRKRR